MTEREFPEEWLEAISRVRGAKVYPRDLESLRDRVTNGLCPFCERGPFAMVAGHVRRVHDVDRIRLRDLLGFTKAEVLTSPELHESAVARGKRHYNPRTLTNVGKDTHGRVFTQAGREAQALKSLGRRVPVGERRTAAQLLEDMKTNDPAAYARFVEQRREASQRGAAKRRRPDAFYADVVRVYLEEFEVQPWGVYLTGARRLGLKEATFRQRVREASRRGLLPPLVDGRSLGRKGPRSEARWEAYWAAHPKPPPVSREEWIRKISLSRMSENRRYGFFCVVCHVWAGSPRNRNGQTTCSKECLHERDVENGKRNMARRLSVA